MSFFVFDFGIRRMNKVRRATLSLSDLMDREKCHIRKTPKGTKTMDMMACAHRRDEFVSMFEIVVLAYGFDESSVRELMEV
jgi:hypothetical protein